MPTLLSHPAFPIALGLGLGKDTVPPPLLAAGAVASVLPDLDVVGLRLGIPYASALGHRGLSHSLVLAATVAVAAAACHRTLRSRAATAFAFVFLATASHALLDAFTTGGLGVALLWPFSADRFFAPVRVILVAPLGVRGLASRAPALASSELLWVWAPCVTLGVLLRVARRKRAAAA